MNDRKKELTSQRHWQFKNQNACPRKMKGSVLAHIEIGAGSRMPHHCSLQFWLSVDGQNERMCTYVYVHVPWRGVPGLKCELG